MEQEITVTPDIVSYFYESISAKPISLEITNHQKCIEILKDNYLASDKSKNIFKEMKNEFDKLEDDSIKKELENIFTRIFKERIKIFDYDLEKSDWKYFKLCNVTNDKIYFNPREDENNIKELRIKISNQGMKDIELHNMKTFIEPNSEARLKNTTRVEIIAFDRENKYDFVEILKPYLREAKEIKVIDKYLPNCNSIFHLDKILKSISKDCKVTFVTLEKENYLLNKKNRERAEKDYKKFIEIAKNFKADIEPENESGHVERYMITDKYEITLPGGFDQFDKMGRPKDKTVNKILKMMIEKKKL